jgi:hypothetical protein
MFQHFDNVINFPGALAAAAAAAAVAMASADRRGWSTKFDWAHRPDPRFGLHVHIADISDRQLPYVIRQSATLCWYIELSSPTGLVRRDATPERRKDLLTFSIQCRQLARKCYCVYNLEIGLHAVEQHWKIIGL